MTVVGVLSLGGATGLSGPFLKDATQFVGAIPSSGASGVVVEDEVGTSAVSVSEVNAANQLGAGGIGGPTLDMADDLGIPATVLDAYKKAAKGANVSDTRCAIRWQILAGIGKVESNHAAGGRLNAAGAAMPAILGPVLNGGGFASISDHDGGRWDGDSTWDRAVGPMQFIPATWKAFGVDGSGDGVPDPNNVYDSTLAAANYLCHGSADLSTDSGLTNALLRYNHSMAYVATVRAWIATYDAGLVVTDDLGPVANLPVPTGQTGGPTDDVKSTDQKDNDNKDSTPTADPPTDDPTSDPPTEPDPEPDPDPTEPDPDPTEPEPDTEAPSRVVNLTATVTGPTSIDLGWDAATDNVGVAIYEITHGDGSLTEIAGDSTSATIEELAPDTTYDFRVRAVDAAGNPGSFSEIVSATTGGEEPDPDPTCDPAADPECEPTDDPTCDPEQDGEDAAGAASEGDTDGELPDECDATTPTDDPTGSTTDGPEDPNTSTTIRVTSPWRGRTRNLVP